MKLLVQCYTTEQESVFCNFAIVQFDLNKLLERRTLAKQVASQDSSFNKLLFWDNSAKFYEGYIEPEEILSTEQLEKFERDQFVIVQDDFELSGEKRPRADFENPMRTEVDTICVSDDAFYWSSDVKHCDVRVETFQIPFAAII